jgi:hypothetical protein
MRLSLRPSFSIQVSRERFLQFGVLGRTGETGQVFGHLLLGAVHVGQFVNEQVFQGFDCHRILQLSVRRHAAEQ